VSQIDRQLVSALGIPVARVAGALNKSRQTVTRGLHSDGDYFKPSDLAAALTHWRTSDAGLYALAKAKICELYPQEVADAVIRALEAAEPTQFTPDIPGEYWLICGDFFSFRTSSPMCARQLEAVCGLDETQVKVFINKRDMANAQRWCARHGDHHVHLIVTPVDLLMMPSTLLRIDHDDNIDLFGVSDRGFVGLARHEAARMRVVVEDTLLVGADAQ
jgi:hypothetical protein